MNYVGIDIHKRYSVCAAKSERGRSLGGARIEGNSRDGFVQYFGGLGGRSKVVIEACWNWGKTYDLLESLPQVAEVVLGHPLKTQLIADAQIKTDRLDGAALAMLLRGNLIARAHVPRPATRRRKDLLRQPHDTGSGKFHVCGVQAPVSQPFLVKNSRTRISAKPISMWRKAWEELPK